MLEKLRVCTYFLLLLVPGVVNAYMSAAANPNPIFNADGQEIASLNILYNASSSHTDGSVFIPTQGGHLASGAGYHTVQTQSGATIQDDPEEDYNQSSTTRPSHEATQDEVASSNISNGQPSSGAKPGSATSKSTSVKCDGSALCVTGEVVKVINGKTFYVNIQKKVYKVELALIGLPLQSEDAMRAATTFTRNTCLGSNVLIDQDDKQKAGSFIAQVYCSPTKHLNSLLLQTGYVQLDKLQCTSSEFSKLDWAQFYGC